MSTAENIADTLGNNGQIWETVEGLTLSEISEANGGVTEHEEHDDPSLVPHRIVFPDSSAICFSENCWDVEGSRPFLMSGLE